MMPSILLTTVLPALVPALADGVRALIGKFVRGEGSAEFQPQNIAEAIQLKQAETERLKALAELDKPSGDISRWVADLRASTRYILTILILLTAVLTLFYPAIPTDYVNLAWDAANSAWSFVFGDRMYTYLKRGK